MIATIDVDWGALLEALYVSAIAGLGVIALATIAVSSELRGAESRGSGGSVGYRAVTVLAIVGLVAVIVFGIYIMTQK